jgi:transposase
LGLSQKKKTQIAACHGKGMTVSEIAARCGLVEGVVSEFLESIGKTPNKSERRKNNRLTDEQKEEIYELLAQGKGTTEIARLTGINVKTVNNYKFRISKEKEPATAATVTDSMDAKTGVCDTVSISKDNTIEPKSQEQTDKLQGVNVLAVLENTLNDWLGIVGMGMIDPQATIVELSASVDDAAVTFEYKGERYFLTFGRR